MTGETSMRACLVPARAGLGRRRGFSITELMVAIAIAGILTAIAIPSFQSVFMSMRLTSYANELVATTMLARSTAINQNAPVVMCQSLDGATCGNGSNWETGYVVVCSSNDGTVCTNTPGPAASRIVLKSQGAAATGWKITGAAGASSIQFESSGSGATTASLTVCRHEPVGTNERVVRISPTGRSSVSKTSNGVCT